MNLDRETENRLIERCRQGDTDAFDELVAATQRSSFALAYRWTQDRDAAFDMVQEGYIKLYRFLPRWNYSCRVTTWLYRTLANTCIDHHRRRRFETVGLGDPEHDDVRVHEPLAGDQSPPELIANGERASTVRACVKQLPERMRQAVQLRYLGGLSLREVSEVQHCSIGTIKATIHQALKKLRLQLRQLEGGVI